MTVKEFIIELNKMIANGEITENAKIRNAEYDDIFSVVDRRGHDEVIIYF